MVVRLVKLVIAYLVAVFVNPVRELSHAQTDCLHDH